MKIGLLFSKNWQKLEYKTAPKVQKLNTRQASIEEFTVIESNSNNANGWTSDLLNTSTPLGVRCMT